MLRRVRLSGLTSCESHVGHSLNFGEDVICDASRIMARNIHSEKEYNKLHTSTYTAVEEVSVARLLSRARGLLLGIGSDMLKKSTKTFSKSYFINNL